MLNIALGELTPGSADQMLAGEVWCDRSQRHAVLQLVAEPVCTARLIESRSCTTPDTPTSDREASH